MLSKKFLEFIEFSSAENVTKVSEAKHIKPLVRPTPEF